MPTERSEATRRLTPERSALAGEYLPFAMKTAQRWLRSHKGRKDACFAVDVAVDRLMFAASQYDEGMGVKFFTYLARHLRFGRLDYVRGRLAPAPVRHPVNAPAAAAALRSWPDESPSTRGFDDPDDELYEHLRAVPERRDREILWMEARGWTRKEICAAFGLSESRVSHLVLAAQAAIRDAEKPA